MTEQRLTAIEERVARLEGLIQIAPPPASEKRLVAAMLRYAADLSGLELAAIRTRRDARHAQVRFAVMYAARETLGYSFRRIGRAMSLDHSSVVHGVFRTRQLRTTDPLFRILVERLIAAFQRILADPSTLEVTV